MEESEISGTRVQSQGRGESSDTILETESDPDIPLLEDFPNCGLLGSHNSSLYPWLGALYAVDMKGAKEAKLISSVALLSATTRNQPNLPTIVVAPGSIIQPYTLSLGDTGVFVSGHNTITAADLETLGLRAEVRFGDRAQVTLSVLSIVQHPHFAATECFVEPCGPPRYNNKNDLAVLHLDTTPLWDGTDRDNVFPACLPEEGGMVTSVGWQLEQPGQRLPVLDPGVLDRHPTVKATRISASQQKKLTRCRTVARKSVGAGVYLVANGTLCVPVEETDRPTRGDLLIGRTSQDAVSVLGLLQNPDTTYLRPEQDTATRLSCFLGWIAEQYRVRWRSRSSIMEAGTCPDQQDSPVGALGTHTRHNLVTV